VNRRGRQISISGGGRAAPAGTAAALLLLLLLLLPLLLRLILLLQQLLPDSQMVWHEPDLPDQAGATVSLRDKATDT